MKDNRFFDFLPIWDMECPSKDKGMDKDMDKEKDKDKENNMDEEPEPLKNPQAPDKKHPTKGRRDFPQKGTNIQRF